MTTVGQFENRVWELERIRVVVRADRRAEVGKYGFGYKARRAMTVARFVEDRIMGSVGNFGVAVVDGSGRVPGEDTPVGTVRDSYRK